MQTTPATTRTTTSRTYRLGSCPMIHAPSIAAATMAMQAKNARRVLCDGWGIPTIAADLIRAGCYDLDGDVVIVVVE